MPLTPRLIEHWMPVNQVSTEAIRERAAASALPPLNWLHVWWARRPQALSRATTLLSLLPQSADAPETRQEVFGLLGTFEGIHKIAKRLADAKANGVKDKDGYKGYPRAFTHNPSPEQLTWFQKHLPTEDPVVLDVTAGGGSIPFEASRLGLVTIANELNPVAGLLLRATCEWPQTYGYPLLNDYRQCAQAFLNRVDELMDKAYPNEPEPDCADGKCPHPQRYRCVNRCDDRATCTHKKLGDNTHHTVHAQRHVWAYLWARTILCSACQCEIPLSPNWRLDDKGTGIRVEPRDGQVVLSIIHNQRACSDCKEKGHKECYLADLYPDHTISEGTVDDAIAICPNCGSTSPKGYISSEAQAGRMSHRLFCIIYRDSWLEKKKDGTYKKKPTTCRIFVEPQDRHHTGEYFDNKTTLAQARWEGDDILPSEPVPVGNDQRPHTYDMEEWVKMFNPRQQLAHGHCVQAFRECVDTDNDGGNLNERRRAAWAYIAIALDKLINRNSMLTRWDGGTNKIAGTFDRHDFAFKWSYSEMAVNGPGLGLAWSVKELDECLSEILTLTGHDDGEHQPLRNPQEPRLAPPSNVTLGDARDLHVREDFVDCIVFDPPYEENVCYAELSDFFYVWLKRTAGYVFPEDFTSYLTEKDQEAISSPARFKNQATKRQSAKKLALKDYQDKMSEIFVECRRVIKPDGIMTVMFNHKSTAAWDALTVALIEAGFSVTRTWPVMTESESSIHIKDRAAARTTILLVCRPREDNPFPRPWHEVEQLIAQAVQDDIRENLSQAELKPIDLYLSAFGPALRVISEHWGTERETDNPERPEAPFLVTPTDALQVARREVGRHRATGISADWANSPTDPNTKFYVLAKDATENNTLLFDEANLLARAIGVPLEKNDIHIKRIVGFKGDKVNLLSAKDRMAARDIGEDINTRSTLDIVQTAIALTERRNTLDAQQWLTQRMHDANDGQFRYTLEALINTTKLGHDDYHAQRNLWQALYDETPDQPTKGQAALL